MRLPLLLLLGAFFTGSAFVAQGPPARGRIVAVFDAETGAPIAAANVTDLVTGDHALTSETGNVSLWFIRKGGSLVEIRKLGYEPWRSLIDPGDTASITVVMTRLVELAPVVSTAKQNMFADPGRWDGFEARCQSTLVTCYRPDEIAEYPSHTLGDFVARAEGVTAQACNGARRSPGGPANACGVVMKAAGPGTCRPAYVVDGFLWDTKTLGSPIDGPHGMQTAPFSPSNTKAIEVYSTEVPRPLRWAADANCGVVVIWTK